MRGEGPYLVDREGRRYLDASGGAAVSCLGHSDAAVIEAIQGQLGPEVRVSAVKFGSRAKKSGFEQGFKIAAVKVPTDRPSEHWVYIPGPALVALVWFLQGMRQRRPRPA